MNWSLSLAVNVAFFCWMYIALCRLSAAVTATVAAAGRFRQSAALACFWLFAVVLIVWLEHTLENRIAFVVAAFLSCPLLFLRDRSAATP